MTDGTLIKWQGQYGYIEQTDGVLWAVFRSARDRADTLPLEPMTWTEIVEHAEEIAETRRLWEERGGASASGRMISVRWTALLPPLAR